MFCDDLEKIERVSVAVQIGGELFFAKLDKNNTDLFLQSLPAFCENSNEGLLALIRDRNDLKITALAELIKRNKDDKQLIRQFRDILKRNNKTLKWFYDCFEIECIDGMNKTKFYSQCGYYSDNLDQELRISLESYLGD